jgi:hypothetical protein
MSNKRCPHGLRLTRRVRCLRCRGPSIWRFPIRAWTVAWKRDHWTERRVTAGAGGEFQVTMWRDGSGNERHATGFLR